MVSRIGELMEENIREQELKRKSDLKALQAQINPHFLYNTLDSIIWMGEMNKSEEVVKMTAALSRLFRISISKGGSSYRSGMSWNMSVPISQSRKCAIRTNSAISLIFPKT